MNKNIVLLTLIAAGLVAFAYFEEKRSQSVIYKTIPVTVEYSLNGELVPPVHITGPSSIHIITGADDKLVGVQIIPIELPAGATE